MRSEFSVAKGVLVVPSAFKSLTFWKFPLVIRHSRDKSSKSVKVVGAFIAATVGNKFGKIKLTAYTKSNLKKKKKGISSFNDDISS